MASRVLGGGQRSLVLVGGPDLSEPEPLFETSELLIEAPNWSLDGTCLYVNGDGLLWRLPVDHDRAGGRRLQQIRFTGLPDINNDHVLDPNGRHVFMSASDGHIYRGSLAGGEVVRITPEDHRWHFLHGVSGDGRRLAYVEIEDFARQSRLMIISSDGGTPVHVPTGEGHLDGPEWSPDGAWILYNTEAFTTAPGHAQLARIGDPVGHPAGVAERLRVSDTVDWFPHASPDGQWASYVAFPAGTTGHPADRDVVVHVVSTEDWTTSVRRYPVLGGQGTMNVNSWAPDSSRFAFLAYPR